MYHVPKKTDPALVTKIRYNAPRCAVRTHASQFIPFKTLWVPNVRPKSPSPSPSRCVGTPPISPPVAVPKHPTRIGPGHKGQRSSIGRFSLRKWCKPTALQSKLRMSSLYIGLHDAYRRTTTSQARESWCVFYIIIISLIILLLTRTRTNARARLRCNVIVLRYPSWIRASFM